MAAMIPERGASARCGTEVSCSLAAACECAKTQDGTSMPSDRLSAASGRVFQPAGQQLLKRFREGEHEGKSYVCKWRSTPDRSYRGRAPGSVSARICCQELRVSPAAPTIF